MLSLIVYHTTDEFSTFRSSISQSIYSWVIIDESILQIVFLPVLIFSSSFATSAYILGKQIEQILWLAIPGVVVGTLLTGVFIHNILPYDWEWNVSLLLGSIVSATDPVSVVSILKELGAPEKVATLIEGESLFNDGTAIVAFELFLESVLGTDRSPAEFIAYGARLSLGGPALGILAGIIGCYVLSCIFNDPVAEITVTVLLAYGAFVICTVAKLSGVLAVVFLGLWLSLYGRGKISPTVYSSLDNFWVMLEFIANTLIFFATGLIVVGQGLLSENIRQADWGYMLLLYIWLIAVRAFMLILSWPVFQCGQYSVSWQQMLVINHAGLRGAVSLILALIVEGQDAIDIGQRQKVLFHTSGIVVLSLVINGSTTKFLVQKLGLNRTTEARKDVFEHAVNAIEAKLEIDEAEFMKDPFLANANWPIAWRYIPVLTAECLWRRISLGHIKLSGVEVKDIRKSCAIHDSQRRSLYSPSPSNPDSIDFSYMLRDAKDRKLESLRETSFMMSSSQYLSNIQPKKLWRHSAIWRYSHLPSNLRIWWFDILKMYQYDPEMIGEDKGMHIDDFLNKYSMAGEKEPPREWDLEEESKRLAENVAVSSTNESMSNENRLLQNDGTRWVVTDDPPMQSEQIRSGSLSLYIHRPVPEEGMPHPMQSDEPIRSQSLSNASLHRHRHRPVLEGMPQSKKRSKSPTRIDSVPCVSLEDEEEIKEARMRFLASIKAAYLSQFQCGRIIGDVYTILQSSVLEIEDEVDSGGKIGTSSLLQRVKNASFLPESTIFRWFNWWPARIPIMGYLSNRVFHFLSIAWNMRIAFEHVNLKDLYGDRAFALNIVKREVEIQVTECKTAVDNICKAAPFISRAFKTRLAARVFLFRYQQHVSNLHMSGHILEAEADVISERITRNIVALSNHPVTEGLEKLVDVCRSIECLHTLSVPEIERLISSEALTEHEIVGPQTLLRIGDRECANGRKGWYYLIRGSVIRTVPVRLNHCTHLNTENGQPGVQKDKDLGATGGGMVEKRSVSNSPQMVTSSSLRGVFLRCRAGLRPNVQTVSSEHHRGLLFGISDALLLHPQHAGYHTKEVFTHLVFFDLHKMIMLADQITTLKEGLWRTVGAHSLRHAPQYHQFTLRSLHKLLHESLFHEIKAGSQTVEVYVPQGATVVVLRGSVNISENSTLEITKLGRDEGANVSSHHDAQMRKPVGEPKVRNDTYISSNLGSKIEYNEATQTIYAPLVASCLPDGVGEMLYVVPLARDVDVGTTGAIFFILSPKDICVAHHESTVIQRVGSKGQGNLPIIQHNASSGISETVLSALTPDTMSMEKHRLSFHNLPC